MADKATTGDEKSSPKSPLDRRIYEQRTPGRGDTAESKDKIDLAIERLLKRADDSDKHHRTAKAAADALVKEMKAYGVTPGEAVTIEKLPINRQSIEKASDVLKGGKQKVKDFQRGMGFFDTQELARVRKALVAAGVTEETGEGSVVFISLTKDFAEEIAV